MPDALRSTVTLDREQATADGVDAATLTVTIESSDGAPIAGMGVTLVSSTPDVMFAPLPVTDEMGQSHTTVTSTVAGAKMLSVEIAGQQPLTLQAPPLTFTAGAATKLVFVTQPTTSEAGAVLAPVQVAFADAFDNVVTDAVGSIRLSLMSGGSTASMAGTTSVGVTDGVATFTNLKIYTPATGLILQAYTFGLPTTDSEAFDIVYGEPASVSSTLTVTPATAIADSLDEVAITATLRNAEGIPIPAYAATVSVSGSGNALYPGGAVMTDAQGSFSLKLSSTVAEPKVVSMTAGTLSLMASVQFYAPSCEPWLTGLPTRFTNAPVMAMVAADVDGDGHQDLALAELTQLAVLRGNGTGHFHAPVLYPTGTYANSIAAADFDGDGDVDLVMTDQYAGMLFIFVNNGTGGFTKSTMSIGSSIAARAVVATDFDGDTVPDLAMRSEHDVWIYRGVGNATFMTPIRYTLDSSQLSVSGALLGVADLNQDGKKDLFTLGNGYHSVLLGGGNGTFQLQTAVYDGGGGGGGGGGLAFADFDTDGDIDVISGLTFWRSNGDGTFATGVFIGRSFEGARNVAAADIDGDGKQDLISAAYDNEAGGIDVRHGNGDASFSITTLSIFNEVVSALAVADFNEDGRLDVAASEGGASAMNTGSLSVLLGEANARFPGARYRGDTVGSGRAAFFGLTGDFDGNGTLDFVAQNQVTKNIGVQLSATDGTLTAMPTVAATSTYEGVAKDFNGDGKVDLLGLGGPGLAWYQGNGDGTLQAAVGSSLPGGWAVSIAIADLDNDGHDDAATVNPLSNTVTISFGNGAGAWTNPIQFATGTYPNQLRIADLDANGLPDLVVVNTNGPSISVLVNQGNRAFAAAVTYPGAGKPDSAALADYDGDGKIDVVVANGEGNSFTLFKGNGDATFAAGSTRSVGVPVYEARAVDIDGNGTPDVLLTGIGLHVLRNLGDATFLPDLLYDAGAGREPVIADFNADGRPDVMIPIGDFTSSSGFSMLYNAGCH